MNLQGIVGPYVRVINPALQCTIRRSNGTYTVQPDGTRVPGYSVANNVTCDFQALSANDLKMLDGVNTQGDNSAVYITGQLDGVERPRAKGGDLIVTPGPNSETYLVTKVLEDWREWTKVAATLQNGG